MILNMNQYYLYDYYYFHLIIIHLQYLCLLSKVSLTILLIVIEKDDFIILSHLLLINIFKDIINIDSFLDKNRKRMSPAPMVDRLDLVLEVRCKRLVFPKAPIHYEIFIERDVCSQ